MYVSSCGSHCRAACPWGEAAPLWRGWACFLSRACLYLDAHQFSDDLSYECFIQEPKYELVQGKRPWERKGKVESCMPTRCSKEEHEPEHGHLPGFRVSTVCLRLSVTFSSSDHLTVSLCPFNTHTCTKRHTNPTKARKMSWNTLCWECRRLKKHSRLKKSHVPQLQRVIAIIICYERWHECRYSAC